MESEPSLRAQARRGLGTAARYGPAAAVGAGVLVVAGAPIGGIIESTGRASGYSAALPEAEQQRGETQRLALELGVRDPETLRALGGDGGGFQFTPGLAVVVIVGLAAAFVLSRRGK